MYKEPLGYLKHIRDECSYILSVIPEDFSKDAFISDEISKELLLEVLR